MTSQHLNKTSLFRWRRRPVPIPGADDARALAAANRRIVQLESQNAVLQNRIDRHAGQCTPPCWHAARLEAAEVELLCLRAEQADVYAHIRGVLDKVREANAEHPARGENGAGR